MPAKPEETSRRNMEWVSIDLEERTELIDRTRWGKEFPWKQLQIFAQYTQPYRVRQGEIVFREGDRESYMCLLLAGRVRVMKDKGSLGPRQITVLGRGQAFGEMSLIDGEPRSATIQAVTDVLLLMMRADEFNALLEKYPQVGILLVIKLAKAVSQRLRMTSGALVDALEMDEEP